MKAKIMNKNGVLCIGGLNVDWTAISSVSSFPIERMPFTFKLTLGGVIHNIAQNLKSLGQEVSIISALGKDVHGDLMVRALQKSEIGCQYLGRFSEKPTASIVFVVGPDGEFLLNVVRTEIYALLTPAFFASHLKKISAFQTWVIDTDLTAEAIAFLVQSKPKTTKLFGIIAAPPLAVRVLPVLSSFDGLFMNKEEASCLVGEEIRTFDDALNASNFIRNKGTQNVFITLGKDGVCVNTPEYCGIMPALKIQVHDTKGAGDAFASAVIEGFLDERKKPIKEIVQKGLIASSLAIEVAGHSYGMLSKKAIKERAKLYA